MSIRASIRALIVPCLLLTLLVPGADAKTRHSKIPKNAKYKNITGAKKQKLTKHR
jgi:hypothetical protein